MIFSYLGKQLNYEYKKINANYKTVVLLHGWEGNLNSFMPIYSAFNNCNILSVDFWGFGQSDKPNADFSIFSYADTVFALIKVLKIDRCVIVGHSFGGRVALILSATAKETIDKLILIDSAGLKPKFSLKRYVKVKMFKLNKRLVKMRVKKEKCLNKYGSEDYKKLSDDEKLVFNRIINQDLTIYAKNVFAETLILWGEKDTDTPIYMAKRLHKYIKNSKLFIMKQAGHFSYVDCPNIVINLIKDFI